MQITEVSVLGVRSSVTRMVHPAAPLVFLLFPMIHVALPQFYEQVTCRLGTCDLVVAEGADAPSSTGRAAVAALRLTRQPRAGSLVWQAIDYAALGVPTVWPESRKSGSSRIMARIDWWLDLVFMVPFFTIVMLASGRQWLLTQHFEVNDLSEVRVRMFSKVIIDERDEELIRHLDRIHEERHDEPITVAVVYGAGHMPAVIRALARLGYRPRSATWLTAIEL